MKDAPDCQHVWKCESDYEGDPSVPGGIHTWITYRCIFCDCEVSSIPDDEVPEVEDEKDDEG